MPGAFAPTRRDLDWVLRIDDTCSLLVLAATTYTQWLTCSHNVMQRYVLSNSDNERDLGLNGFFDRLATLRRCYEDGRGIRFELFLCLPQIWQQGKPQVLALLARCHAAYDVRAICETVLGIPGRHSPSEALVDDPGVLSNAEILDCIIVRRPG